VINLETVKINIKNKSAMWKQVMVAESELSFAGYLYVNDKLYTQHTIENYFKSISFSRQLIDDWQGEFALIYRTASFTFAAVDRKRSIPLFYRQEGKSITITDQLTPGNELQTTSAVEFILTGFVANERTLFKDNYQIEAGQYLYVTPTGVSKEKYYRYYHHPVQKDFDVFVDELTETFHLAFKRLVERIKNKHVMIPLSGGYDSRIIALLLKEYGVGKISSFTYGREENPEAKKSKEIADRLGIPWSFYKYSREDWKKWYHSNEWKEYLQFATNTTSMAHLQDWPAVTEIIEQQDDDFVFIPGHSGDFIAGSHLSYELTVNKIYTIDEVISHIMKKHHRLWETKNQQAMGQVITEIKASLDGLDFENREQAGALFEYWDWKERQAKFIINSVRVYEYYGKSWAIPLWDDQLMNFFLNVPIEHRFKKFLYDSALYKMFPDYFAAPLKQTGSQASLKEKYGVFYSLLKQAYNKKRIYQQYHKDPMEWFGITGNYLQYLLSTTFSFQKVTYTNPYNINSFLVKDYIQKELK
jgi:asparagine synthase (glutamine-hydrolysing)